MDSLVTIDTRRFLGQGPDTYSPLTATQRYMLKTRPANSFEANHPAFPVFPQNARSRRCSSHSRRRRRRCYCRSFPFSLCFSNSRVENRQKKEEKKAGSNQEANQGREKYVAVSQTRHGRRVFVGTRTHLELEYRWEIEAYRAFATRSRLTTLCFVGVFSRSTKDKEEKKRRTKMQRYIATIDRFKRECGIKLWRGIIA